MSTKTSKQSFDEHKNVDKRSLCNYVHSKLDGAISGEHIACVISIMFEEMLKELLTNHIVPIGNFGDFLFRKMPARRHMNIATKQCEISPGKQIIRFRLSKKLRHILLNKVDLDKTITNNYNEDEE
jgi:nucleoid DNA-binding protein